MVTSSEVAVTDLLYLLLVLYILINKVLYNSNMEVKSMPHIGCLLSEYRTIRLVGRSFHNTVRER